MTDDARLFELFGRPPKPSNVWEKQFDGLDHELRRLADCEWQEMDRCLLRDVYFDQLAYVKDRQADLFCYLFPVCLMEWRDSLFRGESMSGGTDFHVALLRGRVIETLAPQQVIGINQYLFDSCVSWLEQVPSTLWRREIPGRCHAFLGRVNSMAAVFDCAGRVIDEVLRSRRGGRLAIAECFLACLLLDERINPFMSAMVSLFPDPIEDGMLLLRWADFVDGMSDRPWTAKSYRDLDVALQPSRVFADAASVFGASPDKKLREFAGRESGDWALRIQLFLDLCRM